MSPIILLLTIMKRINNTFSHRYAFKVVNHMTGFIGIYIVRSTGWFDYYCEAYLCEVI